MVKLSLRETGESKCEEVSELPFLGHRDQIVAAFGQETATLAARLAPVPTQKRE